MGEKVFAAILGAACFLTMAGCSAYDKGVTENGESNTFNQFYEDDAIIVWHEEDENVMEMRPETDGVPKLDEPAGEITEDSRVYAMGTGYWYTETEETKEDVYELPDGKKYMYVTANSLYMRTGPGTNYEVLTKSLCGERVVVNEMNGKWAEIELADGTICYAHSAYLSETPTETPLDDEFDYSFSNLTVVEAWNTLYTYEDMAEDIRLLCEKYPEMVSSSVAGKSVDGRDIYCITVGNPMAEKNIMVTASTHGREYMSTVLVMKQLEYYLANMENGAYNETSYKDLFKDVAFYIVPMVNPDGVTISQSGTENIVSEEIKKNLEEWYNRDVSNDEFEGSFREYMTLFKANANGVDINRNFPAEWDTYGGNSFPGALRYKGEYPASEPETLTLMSLTEKYQPIAIINYHVTGSLIYWDIDQEGVMYDRCLELAEMAHNLTGYDYYDIASLTEPSTGFEEWAVLVKNIPAIVIEVGKYDAPLDADEFTAIWRENREMWVAAAELAQEWREICVE